MNNRFSDQVTHFQGRLLPEAGKLVGYSYLIAFLETESQVKVPVPDKLSMLTNKHSRYDTEFWEVFTVRHAPKESLEGNLVFALKYEGIDLYILKKIFENVGKEPVISMMTAEPTSQYSRKIWFLYEWLFGIKLDLPDLKVGTYVEIVNQKLQYAAASVNSTRHRVKNNLPGTPAFCPMARKTKKLEGYLSKELTHKMERGLSGKNKDLVNRMSAFLLLKDSKASFAIEGENPHAIRARNWGKAIGQAGKDELTIKELERLQDIVIGSRKLKNMGIRTVEGFIGEHDRDTFSPLPDHISAKAADLNSLLSGLLNTNKIFQGSKYDPVLAAATIAFGFVFIHPFSDGNGRLHRYLIHHILMRMGYTRRGMIFPVSAAILNRIDEYQLTLENYSSNRIDLIDWRPTSDHSVEILSETVDLYRYFDVTAQAEFLYDCIQETIETIIPTELDYLEKYDQLTQLITDQFSMPNSDVDLLIKLLVQNNGQLSTNKRKKYLEELTDEEMEKVEDAYQLTFGEK